MALFCPESAALLFHHRIIIWFTVQAAVSAAA